MGGLFEQFTFSGSTVGASIKQDAVRSMAAVIMAINRINDKQNGYQLLPRTKVWFGYILCAISCRFLNIFLNFLQLELLIGDIKGQEKNAKEDMFRYVERGSVALIGPETSSQTIAVSRLLSLPSVDRALIGHSATSTKLSDSEFSKFVRTIPSDDIAAQGMAKLMKGLLVDLLRRCDLIDPTVF